MSWERICEGEEARIGMIWLRKSTFSSWAICLWNWCSSAVQPFETLCLRYTTAAQLSEHLKRSEDDTSYLTIVSRYLVLPLGC